MGQIITDPFDFIFIDYFLATTTAPDVILTLRDAGFDNPIFVLSAKNFTDSMIEKLENAGGNDYYLKKKFNATTIQTLIHLFLEVSTLLYKETEKIRELSQLTIIYKDGRLIQNYNSKNGKLLTGETDSSEENLFASSITAVNLFLQEAAHSGSPFKEIKSEGMTIMLERGKWIAAVAITKSSNPHIRYNIHKMINRIENTYSEILNDWMGDLSKLQFDQFVKSLDDYAK